MIIACAVLDEDGLVHQVGPVSAPSDPVGWRVRHKFAHDPLELTSIRPGTITAGHGGPLLGLIQHAERGERQTWIVADVASLNARSDQHGSLYASIEGEATRGRLKLRAVALVPATASVGLPPIRILSTANGVADSEQVDVLRLRTRDRHGAALLERARAAVRDRPRGEPPRVLNQRSLTVERLEGGRYLVDGELTAVASRPPGELWHRGGGYVLAVR